MNRKHPAMFQLDPKPGVASPTIVESFDSLPLDLEVGALEDVRVNDFLLWTTGANLRVVKGEEYGLQGHAVQLKVWDHAIVGQLYIASLNKQMSAFVLEGYFSSAAQACSIAVGFPHGEYEFYDYAPRVGHNVLMGAHTYKHNETIIINVFKEGVGMVVFDNLALLNPH